MHTHYCTEDGVSSDGDINECVLDMREVKSEKEIIVQLGVKSWLELQRESRTVRVTHWERLQRMNKSVAEALIYLANNCDVSLITSSRYPWTFFNLYSPSVIQKHPTTTAAYMEDACFKVVRSMFKGLLGEEHLRIVFEQLKGHYDYKLTEIQAFKKFQPHATQHLASLGALPLQLCTFAREERFLMYAAFIGGRNASKHDALIFGSMHNSKKRRVMRKVGKKAAVVREGRKWVGEERLLAIYHFIVPVPPPALWLAKRVVMGLVEKRILQATGKKLKCLLGEHFLYSMAQRLDNFELERYIYKP